MATGNDMGERVSGDVSFREPLERVAEVLTSIEAYPSWNEGILDVIIDAYDTEGRVQKATFLIDIKLTQLRYTLTYRYDVAMVSWELVDADLLSQFDGEYRLSHADGITTVRYTIDVDVAMALPRVMKRRAAETLIAQTLTGLQTRCQPA
ncbi:MAG: SRPBCC family protein [Nitriliruptoraceae bacterium]